MTRPATIKPPVVTMLLVANAISFVLLLMAPPLVFKYFALWPLDLSGSVAAKGSPISFQPWQLLSYSFLHGGMLHLLLNMYALWLFGSRIEQAWGSKAFIIYYFTCVIGAGLVQLVVASQSGEIYPTVGASGGVFGLLLAFALTYPNERLMLVFPPIIMKAKWFVLLYACVELYAGVTGTLAGIAHFAHLGGMLFGFLLLLYWGRHPLKR